MASGGGIGRLLRQLAAEDWLGRLVDHYFEAKEPERWKKPDFTIHPSGSGDPCARSVQIGMLGHRAAVRSRNRRRMDNGTDAHTRWQRYFADMGVMVAKEWRVRMVEPVVSGRMDLILQNSATGNLAVGEIKTTNSRKFSQLPRSTGEREVNARALYAWHREWFLQFVWYATFGDYNGRKFTEKFFLVENTDNQDYRIIWVEPTADQIEECQATVKPAQVAIQAGEILSCPFERGCKTCKSCDHEKVCRALAGGDEEIWQLIKDQFRKLQLTLKTEPPRPGPGK